MMKSHSQLRIEAFRDNMYIFSVHIWFLHENFWRHLTVDMGWYHTEAAIASLFHIDIHIGFRIWV